MQKSTYMHDSYLSMLYHVLVIYDIYILYSRQIDKYYALYLIVGDII